MDNQDNQFGSAGGPSEGAGTPPAVPPAGTYPPPGTYPPAPVWQQPGPASSGPVGPMGPVGPVTALATPAPAKPAKKRGKVYLAWVGIVVACVVGVTTLGSGVTSFATSLQTAPAIAAAQFCRSLVAQQDGDAYARLSSRARGEMTAAQFRLFMIWLDTAEGKMLSCDPVGGAQGYRYALGDASAVYTATTRRARVGTQTGGLHLVWEGDWKVDALDASFLGVKLGALQTLQAFCAAITTQQYANAFALLGASAQKATPKGVFVHQQQVYDALDGKASSCGLQAVPAGNSETAVKLLVTLGRDKLDMSSGTMTFAPTAQGWRITQLGATALGRDIGPYTLAETFCARLLNGTLAQVYGQFTSGFKSQVTSAQLVANFKLPAGAKYTACTLTRPSYRVEPTKASLNGKLTFSVAGGKPQAVAITWYFFKEAGSWKVDDYSL